MRRMLSNCEPATTCSHSAPGPLTLTHTGLSHSCNANTSAPTADPVANASAYRLGRAQNPMPARVMKKTGSGHLFETCSIPSIGVRPTLTAPMAYTTTSGSVRRPPHPISRRRTRMERALVDLRTHRGGDRRRPRVPPDRRVGQSALGPRRRQVSDGTDLGAVIVVKGDSFGTSGLSLEPLTPHALVSRSLPIALPFCFASFVGFEATAIYSEEAKDPKRTVPRATFLAVIVIGAICMRHRRICHCDASFRPQLGRARISPSGRGGPSALLNRLRAATTSR